MVDFTSLATKVLKKMPILPAADIEKLQEPYKHPYEFYKEKQSFELEEKLVYDKVRWPMSRELIMKRKNLILLP
jgi:hypothetical protein